MSGTTLSHDSYGIGIICALLEEKAAMEMMLDEEHENLEQKSGDHNSYTLGRIGKHNVVIACLPGGHQGKAAAATVAVHMMYSFPIKLGLMVGIGGGVPSQVPTIRLGDVVVSMPEGTHGGVIQYDLGKLETDGFRRKGHLDKPPKALLSAVTSLRAKHERKDPDFPRYLTAISDNRRMATKYGFQGVQHDRLFAAEEIHSENHHICDHCLLTLRTVQRDHRDENTPQVFYGTILSGDLVMKNGEERDRRAAADKAMCFEMEAAGLMNDFPCLVIRGISDYSDSHKNDRWQPYAAATAAAYAKELLGALSAQEVEKLGPAIPFSLKGVPAIDHFVQRVSDMQKLEEYFFPQQPHLTRRKMFVVHGLGGIGKTQLCIEFVRRYQKKYSAVFWLDGSSEDALQRSLIDVVARLPTDEVPLGLVQAAEQASPDERSIVRGVMDWLSLPSNRQWLLVIDNVDRDHTTKVKDPLAYDVKQYLPAADHGNMLVTSRLSTLMAPRNSLRLTEAAAYIGQTAISIVQYLEYYDSMWKDLMEQQDEYPLQEYAQRSVLTTWKISYEQVKKQSEEASNLLQLWSHLYARDLWLKFDRALSLLIKYSLVEGKAETASYAMHSVLHSWCHCLVESEAERESFRKLAVNIVGETAPSKSAKEYWVLQRRLLPHGQAIFTGMKSNSKAETNLDVTWAYQELAGIFKAHDRYIEAEEMYERALAGKENALGLEHKSTLDTVNNLGLLYRDQGRLAEAEAMYGRALAGYEKALGPEHTSTLMTVNNLGILYRDQGRLVEAEAMYGRALAGYEKALGREHTSTLDTVNNLGTLYADQGKLTEAEAMYERALVGREQALGPKHTSTLGTVNSLGNLYADQDRLKEAEVMYGRALVGYEKALGAEHTDTLTTVNNLGTLCKSQGKLVEAEQMYGRALAGYEKTLGLEHTSTLMAVNNLGTLYRDQGRLVEAEAMYGRALAGYEKALGPEHISTLMTVNNLGSLYANQGRLAEAEAMYGRALAGKEKALGREHTSTLNTVNNLGHLYADQGKLTEAEAMYERALAGSQKVLGPEHTTTVDLVQRLSVLRIVPTASTCVDEVPNDKSTVFEQSNFRFSHDATSPSSSSTGPKLISQVEQKKHRPRKRDAFFKKLHLR
ncbi:purine and uridine phosphorylase [Aureobasidium sp. EXF-3400]|nr:purine and uridine phosphorylase [Aureobasidium sp. EXF-3400]